MAEQKKNTKKVSDTVEFKITAKEVEFDDDSFMAYKTQVGKLNLDVRFTKDSKYIDEVEGLEDGGSQYIKVKAKDLSLDTRKKYPIIWIR